ncbi:putative threo-isocitrate dehydrogenase [NAD] [Methanocella paludicola SANAE]|uniref:Threo-isocitrate dehydrogenase [NAD] n=1 Tax=Methanocella paludicola (strain DSM 17711 / JCM 13418 / NBRC 101707 / SANAE) TaxID=304371 RepID=D1Z013_METPS|nr:isocitrate/isopropylmalate family dehydrogenase [Methanocella paludicola]BAI62035.1 putative threo-isocitrate dehydrogenase [NAD] [Methanocella paludicola SANAE]
MKIAVLPGDGIGKEVVPIAVDVLRTMLPEAEYVYVDVGHERFTREGKAMTNEDIETIKKCDCILFGAITSPPKKCYRSVILTLRQALDMYANVRPFKSCSISPYKVDFTIYRENCEDLYCGMEDVSDDQVLSTRKITRHASERIARKACGHPGLEMLTIVHKANVLRSCELFRDVCIDIAKKAGVPYEEMLVDAMAYNLIRNPSRFDVIVTTNLFGDILSDEAAALIGGLGLSPSANIGDRYALFEPVHGSAPDIAGKGIANPIAAVLSAKMLLEWSGHRAKAEFVQGAVDRTISNGILTPDMGGKFKTEDVGLSIVKHLESQ